MKIKNNIKIIAENYLQKLTDYGYRILRYVSWCL